MSQITKKKAAFDEELIYIYMQSKKKTKTKNNNYRWYLTKSLIMQSTGSLCVMKSLPTGWVPEKIQAKESLVSSCV